MAANPSEFTYHRKKDQKLFAPPPQSLKQRSIASRDRAEIVFGTSTSRFKKSGMEGQSREFSTVFLNWFPMTAEALGHNCGYFFVEKIQKCSFILVSFAISSSLFNLKMHGRIDSLGNEKSFQLLFPSPL